jgi:hypothetical protein
MGQAKQRGTLEQRIEQSRQKWDAGIEAQKKEIADLDALEKRQLEAMGRFVDTQVMPRLRTSPLVRIDYSGIELKTLANGLNKA